MKEQRDAQRSLIAQRMKQMGTASVMEQIMVRFIASHQQNQEQLRKCREQFEFLVRKQNDNKGEHDNYEPTLRFDSVRELLKATTGADEMQRVLKKLDTNFDAKIDFDEF